MEGTPPMVLFLWWNSVLNTLCTYIKSTEDRLFLFHAVFSHCTQALYVSLLFRHHHRQRSAPSSQGSPAAWKGLHPKHFPVGRVARYHKVVLDHGPRWSRTPAFCGQGSPQFELGLSYSSLTDSVSSCRSDTTCTAFDANSQ